LKKNQHYISIFEYFAGKASWASEPEQANWVSKLVSFYEKFFDPVNHEFTQAEFMDKPGDRHSAELDEAHFTSEAFLGALNPLLKSGKIVTDTFTPYKSPEQLTTDLLLGMYGALNIIKGLALLATAGLIFFAETIINIGRSKKQYSENPNASNMILHIDPIDRGKRSEKNSNNLDTDEINPDIDNSYSSEEESACLDSSQIILDIGRSNRFKEYLEKLTTSARRSTLWSTEGLSYIVNGALLITLFPLIVIRAPFRGLLNLFMGTPKIEDEHKIGKFLDQPEDQEKASDTCKKIHKIFGNRYLRCQASGIKEDEEKGYFKPIFAERDEPNQDAAKNYLDFIASHRTAYSNKRGEDEEGVEMDDSSSNSSDDDSPNRTFCRTSSGRTIHRAF